MDAVCPGSLEISGHCLAAARVIASLLVGPGNRIEHTTKRQREKGGSDRRVEGTEDNKKKKNFRCIFDFLEMTGWII